MGSGHCLQVNKDDPEEVWEPNVRHGWWKDWIWQNRSFGFPHHKWIKLTNTDLALVSFPCAAMNNWSSILSWMFVKCGWGKWMSWPWPCCWLAAIGYDCIQEFCSEAKGGHGNVNMFGIQRTLSLMTFWCWSRWNLDSRSLKGTSSWLEKLTKQENKVVY